MLSHRGESRGLKSTTTKRNRGRILRLTTKNQDKQYVAVGFGTEKMFRVSTSDNNVHVLHVEIGDLV